jgi:hypothetical protein
LRGLVVDHLGGEVAIALREQQLRQRHPLLGWTQPGIAEHGFKVAHRWLIDRGVAGIGDGPDSHLGRIRSRRDVDFCHDRMRRRPKNRNSNVGALKQQKPNITMIWAGWNR